MRDGGPNVIPASAAGDFPASLAQLRSGEVTLAALLEQVEEALAQRDSAVRSVLPEEGRFERLRGQAAALVERFPDPQDRPPLFGALVGVKDIIQVDGLMTRAGSRLPSAELQGEQASSVRDLIAAGALILGKTVTTEFACFAPGPTRNPHSLTHTPGGSSSGSAAAVAAGLCSLALGTQTIGSVGRPAAYCGITGFKPSQDRISRDGVIAVAPSLDQVGIFAPSVAVMEPAAAVLCAGWRSRIEEVSPPRLAIPVGPYLERAGEEARSCLEAARRRIEAAGYAVHEVEEFEAFSAIEKDHFLLFEGEMARAHQRWWPRLEERYRPRTLELLRRGSEIGDDRLDEARAGCARLRRGLLARMEAERIDLWLTPATTGAAPQGLDSTGDPVMSLPWTQAGLPALTLPAGVDGAGMPLGIRLAGRYGADEELLGWGRAIEQALSVGEAAG